MVANNCHVKYKLITSNTNCSHQKQNRYNKYNLLTSKRNCSHQILNCSHQKQIAHIKNKILTSNTKSRHQIQNPDIKLQNPDIVTKIKRFTVGERKLVSTWCNHLIVVSRYFICNTTVRTTIPHRPTYSYIAVHSSTQPYIALHSRTQVFKHRLCKEAIL